jgi:hypothetical protein
VRKRINIILDRVLILKKDYIDITVAGINQQNLGFLGVPFTQKVFKPNKRRIKWSLR